MTDASWIERLDLFVAPILAALIAGAVAPLVGTFLFVRRTSFYGITLPQFAAAGVVFGFVLLPFLAGALGLDAELVLDEPHAGTNYHLAWAALFTFGGLAALVLASRRGGSEVGRVAAAFAIANAATYLFGRIAPVGRSLVDELFAGEILHVGLHELETVAVVYGAVALALFVYGHDLLLVSYDRESALVLGKRVVAFELLLTAITGLTVATGTMLFGPTLLFGLLVLPPLAARRLAGSMLSFHALASAFGVVAVLGGVFASLELDLPLGASIVGVAALELLPGLLVARARGPL